MKLELKHLSPYLPYKLKCLRGKEVFILNGIRDWIGWSGYFDDKHGSTAVPISVIKPILKRMDILIISPIVMDEMNEIHTVEYNGRGTFVEPDSDNGDPFNAEYLPYSSLFILFKNHFDVFGLIDAGLAIDINTLPELLNT